MVTFSDFRTAAVRIGRALCFTVKTCDSSTQTGAGPQLRGFSSVAAVRAPVLRQRVAAMGMQRGGARGGRAGGAGAGGSSQRERARAEPKLPRDPSSSEARVPPPRRRGGGRRRRAQGSRRRLATRVPSAPPLPPEHSTAWRRRPGRLQVLLRSQGLPGPRPTPGGAAPDSARCSCASSSACVNIRTQKK